MSTASCNQKCVCVSFEADREKANEGARGLREQRIEPDESITVIVFDKVGQKDAYLGALFVR